MTANHVNLKLKTCIGGSMKSIGTYKHAINKLNMINISMNKTSCTSSDYGLTGQIRQGDNPNKETLTIYHISHVAIF